jgi:hypothetical protein
MTLRRSSFAHLASAAVAAALLVASGCGSIALLNTEPTPDSARLDQTVRLLAADSLEGRRTGSPGNDAAANWLASQLLAAGVQPIAPRRES